MCVICGSQLFIEACMFTESALITIKNVLVRSFIIDSKNTVGTLTAHRTNMNAFHLLFVLILLILLNPLQVGNVGHISDLECIIDIL